MLIRLAMLWVKRIYAICGMIIVANAIHGLKAAKSAGPNGLVSELFINSGMKLCIHLSLFYTLCIRHGCLPIHFMDINFIL